MFLEDWSFGTSAIDKGARDPFPERVRLNNAVFAHADPGAMRTLANGYGVTHLIVDKAVGGVSPLLAHRTRLVFANREVAVYALPKAGPARRARSLGPAAHAGDRREDGGHLLWSPRGVGRQPLTARKWLT